ncbi:MAG TPA: pyridoxal phosphate-dependent aminotransferase, partial [Firmicutes bacterium]|nr:pyridoxal phosphate-dependent aminotransferase [Bacillota bacterium]
ELRKAIAEKLKRDNHVEYGIDEIIVSCGAKNCLYNFFMAVLNEGDEVIIPAPYWVSYPQQVLLAGGKPVIVETREEDGFKLKPKDLEANISFATKVLILNNPSNPTGTAYTKEELQAICSLAVKEGLIVLADEIYEKLVYDSFRFTSVASLGEEIKARSVIVNGVSKAYSMTGWRLGYAAGPKEIIAAMAKVQSHNTSNASSISQMAALEALRGPQMDVNHMVSEFQRRRNFVLQRLRQIPNISCLEPKGAFYVFPNVSAYYDKEYNGMMIRNSYGLAYYLLKFANVAIVPGNAFGNDACIRISYATSMENLERAMERIADAMARLRTARKIKRISLDNTVTAIKGTVEAETDISLKIRESLIAEVEQHLSHDAYYEWNANIGGIIVQLRTNVKHLHEFWVDNWYPAELESDLEPHAIIYAVSGIAGREPRAFYNAESRTGIIINCDSYDQVRRWALGVVTDVIERQAETHTIHGACIDFDGKALAIVAPPGVGRGTLCYGLLQSDKARIHSNDCFFVRYTPKEAIADISERKFYVRTRVARSYPYLAPLFDRSKLENVVTSKDDCLNTECENLEDCDLDRGETHCYWASKYSRAMLDPYWIGGVSKYVKRSTLRWLVILRKDNVSRAIEELKPDDALKYLEEGKYTSSGGVLDTIKSEPFYNPYILNPTPERLDLHRRYFQYLLKLVPCYLVNTGATRMPRLVERLLGIFAT